MNGTALAVPRRRLTRLRAVLSPLTWIGAVQSRRKLRAERCEADERLLESRWVSPLLAWRVNELVARKNRVGLARSVRGAVREAEVRYLPNASPMNRAAVRANRSRLLAIAHRLERDEPVAARGVLLADRLLVDGLGPLYSPERADELPSYLNATLEALEP